MQTNGAEPDITIVSQKGQVMIPQSVRVKLGIRPKTKLLVYGYDNAVIMKKIEVPDARKRLEALYKKVDRRISKYGQLGSREIDEIIQEYRRKRLARTNK